MSNRKISISLSSFALSFLGPQMALHPHWDGVYADVTLHNKLGRGTLYNNSLQKDRFTLIKTCRWRQTLHSHEFQVDDVLWLFIEWMELRVSFGIWDMGSIWVELGIVFSLVILNEVIKRIIGESEEIKRRKRARAVSLAVCFETCVLKKKRLKTISSMHQRLHILEVEFSISAISCLPVIF